MIPTKEQERKALEDIKVILSSLGNDPANSYVCRAFDGCVEDAETNIDNDFALSWKERAEAAERKANEYEAHYNELGEVYEKQKAEIAALKEKPLKREIGLDLLEVIQRDRSYWQEKMEVWNA